MELSDPVLLAGNWSQLCATCKVIFFFFSVTSWPLLFYVYFSQKEWQFLIIFYLNISN